MAINFPSGPSDEQQYTDPDTGAVYIYNAAYSVWSLNQAATASVAVANNGIARSTQGTINFIESGGTTITLEDDSGSNRANVTIDGMSTGKAIAMAIVFG